MKISQWHIYLVDLNPKSGTRPGKIRPCLCIRPDYLSDLGSSVILPFTSNVRKDALEMYPTRLPFFKGIAGLEAASDLLIEQITAWDNRKFIAEVGILPEAFRDEVREAVKDFLDL